MGHFMQFILNASLKSVYPHMSFQACLRLITRPKNEQIQLKIQTNVKTLKKKKTFSNHRATKPPQKKPALPNDD